MLPLLFSPLLIESVFIPDQFVDGWLSTLSSACDFGQRSAYWRSAEGITLYEHSILCIKVHLISSLMLLVQIPQRFEPFSGILEQRLSDLYP